MTPEHTQLMKIFCPFAYEKMEKVREKGMHLAHYTSAESAINILKSKQIWMRKTTCMNDFRETVHGWDCLAKSYQSEVGQRFQAVLNTLHEGFSEQIEKNINVLRPSFMYNTYIACFSKHPNSANPLGRLSMWRAYGQPNGVALVFNNGPFLRPSDALKAYATPVAYLDDKKFQKAFEQVTTNMEESREFLQQLDRQTLLSHLYNMLIFAILATKHPGFEEEKEWRAIYSPSLQASTRLLKDTCSISGVPQPIYKIPLEDIPEEGLTGVEVPEFIERIIIGPTQYPDAIQEAFAGALSECGVENPLDRIAVSNIPLR